ncbi:type II toxin-antitoxin system ParD family antitoxin [Sphingomonas lenta]|uniref:Type II toxin-antitoxin system ParD family antitoxin n=1 Tax=Sphingomonas lenta TaxID=1141887 RepID=A0A2A2SI83_9SPHN|nr:type II toxin-antitoxin system ParD family antitoxin [Sphingomonas lenta]PAX08987.1 type II toxin-antitoxin system ParD family antitoxin [Sphingomonas lenta]
MPSRSSLNVSLTPELIAWVEHQVASGRFRSASEVIRAGLRQLQDASAPSSALVAEPIPAEPLVTTVRNG